MILFFVVCFLSSNQYINRLNQNYNPIAQLTPTCNTIRGENTPFYHPYLPKNLERLHTQLYLTYYVARIWFLFSFLCASSTPSSSSASTQPYMPRRKIKSVGVGANRAHKYAISVGSWRCLTCMCTAK